MMDVCEGALSPWIFFDKCGNFLSIDLIILYKIALPFFLKIVDKNYAVRIPKNSSQTFLAFSLDAASLFLELSHISNIALKWSHVHGCDDVSKRGTHPRIAFSYVNTCVKYCPHVFSLNYYLPQFYSAVWQIMKSWKGERSP